MTAHFLTIEKLGSLGVLSLQRPEPGNPLNEEFLAQIGAAWPQVEEDSEVRSICLAGTLDVFMLGADIRFFVRCILANDMQRILRFTRAAHELLAHIEDSSKNVVAWVRGAAYGAGLELALACDRIVAAPNARFALPETGLGIYPGMGGTQRTPRRIGVGLAKWMIFSGAIVTAEQALEIGLIDAIHPTATSALEAVTALGVPRSSTVRSERFAALEKLFTSVDVATLSDPSFAAPTEPSVVRALIQLRSKAPLALRLAESIIDRGVGKPLSEGIEEEFSHLSEIFATEDARTGLLTFGKKTPQFVGR